METTALSSLLRERPASTAEMLEVFGDQALLSAALRFEAKLALVQADLGLIAPHAAAMISNACADVTAFDITKLAEAAAHAGTLAIPLVARIRAVVADPEVARAVHLGATSQDVADTALMLQVKAATALIVRDATRLIVALGDLVDRHAATPMLGRTLLQPALPITFGLKASAWLSGTDGALTRLERETSDLRLQLGGATGTRAGLSGQGAAVAKSLAERLDLSVAAPWHAERQALAGLAASLAILTGVVGKIAGDVALMAQAEIGEAFEPRVEGRGGSSAMAHKRNPTGCQAALSAALRAPGLAATVSAGLTAQQHERGLGGWQAEAPVLADLFGLAHAAITAMADVVEGLEVDAGRMAANLKAAEVGEDVGEAETLALAALARHARKP